MPTFPESEQAGSHSWCVILGATKSGVRWGVPPPRRCLSALDGRVCPLVKIGLLSSALLREQRQESRPCSYDLSQQYVALSAGIAGEKANPRLLVKQ